MKTVGDLQYPALKALRSAADQLPEVTPPCPAWEIPDWVSRRTFAELHAADEAVQQWLKRGEWPVLTADVCAEVRLRIQIALSLLSQSEFQRSTHGMDTNEVLSEALIDSWHLKGIEWVEHYHRKAAGRQN